ncbi:hypothetical protein [Schlesneria paludicola]|uniref:hypothetical protein n=1 Tax=Schlesneria paludicola TaxID=360056 RepID=UPI0012FA7FE6|nr:hypothetical protein [Schlesneria paludicola]
MRLRVDAASVTGPDGMKFSTALVQGGKMIVRSAAKLCRSCSRSRSVLTAVLIVLMAHLIEGATAKAIDVSDPKWGFNGKVAPHRFNMLSVLVNNPTPQTFTGEIILRKSLGGAGYVDATIAETVTLSPSSSKWVQFYPYISSDNSFNGLLNESWQLSYRGGSFDLPTPRIAKYQRIILDDPNSVIARGGALKFHLPDNLFPPFATATDALQLVVLDHVPRWEEARRQAFLDWLYLGGTVVLLHDVRGKFPEFTGPMSVLQSPLDDQLYGAGRVIKMPRNRSQFSDDDLRQICANLPKNIQPSNAEKSDDVIDRDDESEQVRQVQNYGYSDSNDPFKSGVFLSQLKQMTKPDHNWFLLHAMFWAYIALVFPGCYLLGKRWSDFRIVYAGLLGTVAIFSLLFSYVGRRGYGEASAIHTVAIAKPLANGQMDVSTWSNVFVTNGADYDIRHNASGALYSTCNEHEQVKGIINNGAEANFKVDIPPFSNRELATRLKIPFAGPQLTIEKLVGNDGRLSELELAVSGLDAKDVEKQYALIDNQFYQLKWNEGKLQLANEMGSVEGVLRIQEKRNHSYGYGNVYNNGYSQEKSTPGRYLEMFDFLLSRSENISREREAEKFRLPANLISVFLYAKLPVEMTVQNNLLGKQEGRTLYCITLPANAVKPADAKISDDKSPGDKVPE